MGKVTSLYGKTSGKIGSIVFSTSGGEIIAREYNPHVANPNTQAQVNQRARLKLMSQLSASLAPVIAIPRQGLVSSRNAFTKLNFDASMAQNGIAQITYENVQLTNGNLALPSLEAVRAQGSGITINLAEDASNAVNRVVYILYRKTSEQRLQFVASVIAEGAGSDGTFRASLPYTEGDIVLYAYGMRDTSESASAKYGNMQVANAVDVARLTAFRNISTEDFQFTETRGATMYAGQNEITPVPEGSARIFVTAFGGGNVSGGGVYVIGENATVVATAQNGYVFVGWRNNGSSEYVSQNASYTFEVQGTTDLVAVFEQEEAGDYYNVRVRLNPESAAALEAGAKVIANTQEGTDINLRIGAGLSVQLGAVVPSDFNFTSWRVRFIGQTATTVLSNSEIYEYTPSADCELIATIQSGSI